MSKQTDLINIPDAITVSGSNVGIGTSSPSADLDIKRTAGDNNDILRVGSTDNYYHGFARSNTTGALSIQGNQTNFNNILLAPTSGNVGIGTSTPRTESGATTLEVSDSTTARAIIKSTGTGGREYGWYSSTAGQFGLYDYTANTERMRIDSSGNVTTPSQPYFSATCSGNSAYTTFSAGVTLPFNSTARNIGSHFNTSNYRFTAPVAGNYAFSAGVITNSANPVGRPMFFVNGNQDYNTIKFGISGSNTAGAGSTNTSAILHLNANDYVDVRSQSGAMIAYTGGGHSSFTGILIG
jgi:hypothetical protein